MALKMSSGTLASDDLIHNVQWMAADVDNNGVIQAKDAWLINNYVVGKTVANSQVGSWDFVDSNADFKNLGMSNTKLNNDNLKDIASKLGSFVIPTSVKIEQEISLLNDDEKKEYLELMDMEEPVLNKIIFEGYRMLGLETFFTAGPNEIKAWTIKSGSLAPNAAGVIHTDFERGFIKAEVIDYDDFIECSGEQGAKEKGKLRLEGKEYIVEDGDVIQFLFKA